MPPSRARRWLILSALLALHLACNWIAYGRGSPGWTLAFGVIWSDSILLAAWAVLGYGHVLVRLPLVVLLVIVLPLAPLFWLPTPERLAEMDEEALLSPEEIAPLVAEFQRTGGAEDFYYTHEYWVHVWWFWSRVFYALNAIPQVLPLFLLLRFARGWRIVPLEMIERSGQVSKARLSLRALFVQFALIASVFGLLRVLGPGWRGVLDDQSWLTAWWWTRPTVDILADASPFILPNALALLVIPCLGLVLSRGDRHKFAALAVGTLGLMPAAFAAIDYLRPRRPNAPFENDMLLLRIVPPADLLLFFLSALLTLWFLRLAGYRLLRKCDAQSLANPAVAANALA